MPIGVDRKSAPAPVVTQRMQAAAIRACDAHRYTRFLAENVCEELEETTAPHGIPLEVHEEDSLVVVVDKALAMHAKG